MATNAEVSYNPLLDTDSYKASHYLQYPPDTQGIYAYIESRGGKSDETLFFGLQYILAKYLSTRVTPAMVNEAEAVFLAHGEPFNRAGWERVVQVHEGRLPLRIRAVPEGMVVPTGNPLVTVESTDPDLAWLASYVEDVLLRVWYPITVATQSRSIKTLIREHLERTSDDPEGEILFKLHDFGARGVSSLESAGIGGMAHLVNFRGTDTVAALQYARAYYGEPMAGYSIPASEHSTITSWGENREIDAYRNMVRQFGGKFPLFACVADSYDLFHAVENLFGGELNEEIVDSGSILVVRPDSGDPKDMALETVLRLDRKFGSQVNQKGFRVLNHVRVIYGDGINESSIRGILLNLSMHGYSASNIAFGMGGALLQMVNRDDQKMAMKTSAVLRNGQWMEVCKDPVTDAGKKSKRGRVATYRMPNGSIQTLREEEAEGLGARCLMRTVWENGELLVEESFEAVRQRAG